MKLETIKHKDKMFHCLITDEEGVLLLAPKKDNCKHCEYFFESYDDLDSVCTCPNSIKRLCEQHNCIFIDREHYDDVY